MTIEFDMDRTNLHPDLNTPDMFWIQKGAEVIRVTVKRSVSSSIKLMTSDGDFLDEDSTQAKNTQLSVSMHKADAITSNVLVRVELAEARYLLEVKKVIHRREEKKRFLLEIRR